MLLHIKNYMDADRRTAVAGEALDLGVVTIASQLGTTGDRKLMQVTAGTEMLPGVVGVAYKVWAEPLAVTASTVNADSGRDLGSRIISIAEGDLIVEVRAGAILEYDVSLLDDSLNPGATVPGTLPVPGDQLGINPTNGKFCKADVVGAILTPVFGVCYGTFGSTKVAIELQPVTA